MWRALHLPIVAGILFSSLSHAQQTLADQTTNSASNLPLNLIAPLEQNSPVASHSPLYQELDVLRRTGFAEAQRATVSLRITDKDGVTPANLQSSDFTLIVNGTERVGRLHAPGSQTTVASPMVLLVFPPNQPIVHSIAVREAIQYFSQQPTEILPWMVGIFDANGKLIPFTNGRTQLLADLDLVAHTAEPFQYSADLESSPHFRWDGNWLGKAEGAIATMERYEGAKVILAMNPLAESTYGENERNLSNDGPESLTPIAQHIGAHIYIANVGGPDALVPLGEAAQNQPAQINTAGGPQLGTAPSYHMQIDPKQTAALNSFAYRASMMLQTAVATDGGYANSLSDLARIIHHDLDGIYSLDFDLTPQDQDHGIPSVEVKLSRPALHVAVLDVVPVGMTADADREITRRQVAELVKRAAKLKVSSSDFRITQHADYFPLHEGLQPVLPMSGLIEWTGPGRGPAQVSMIESIEDETISTIVLEREVHTHWDGRSLSWERDGRLHPGHYLWRIILHDGNGRILASSEEKVEVAFPGPASVETSSLVLGKSCRDEDQFSGLQHRPASGLKHRPPAGSENQEQVHPQIDPMRAADCRLKPDSTGNFTSTDMLHAFVRIYPAEKLEKHRPESWTAKFKLRSQSGSIETEKEIPFTIDSGSGYLASIELPLDTPEISSGPHTLDVEMYGPGIRHDIKASRSISILPTAIP
jgi:hypothetical protein